MANLSLFHLTRFPKQEAERHPTLLCLHGRGSNEADLIGLAPYLDARLLWISPRAPLELMGGYEWYRLAGIGQPVPGTFEAGLAALDRFISEALAAYPVDPAQLYLMGFSQGSMMAYGFTLAQPERVAGVIAQSGYLPSEATLKDEVGLKDKPFIVTHGAYDGVIPVAWGRAAHAQLLRLGAQAQYHEFPMEHQVSEDSLAVIADWLTKQLG